MNVPSHGELIHLKIQAAMREWDFPANQLEYIGLRDEEHWYRIAGKHEVPVSALEDFERYEDE